MTQWKHLKFFFEFNLFYIMSSFCRQATRSYWYHKSIVVSVYCSDVIGIIAPAICVYFVVIGRSFFILFHWRQSMATLASSKPPISL